MQSDHQEVESLNGQALAAIFSGKGKAEETLQLIRQRDELEKGGAANSQIPCSKKPHIVCDDPRLPRRERQELRKKYGHA